MEGRSVTEHNNEDRINRFFQYSSEPFHMLIARRTHLKPFVNEILTRREAIDVEKVFLSQNEEPDVKQQKSNSHELFCCHDRMPQGHEDSIRRAPPISIVYPNMDGMDDTF